MALSTFNGNCKSADTYIAFFDVMPPDLEMFLRLRSEVVEYFVHAASGWALFRLTCSTQRVNALLFWAPRLQRFGASEVKALTPALAKAFDVEMHLPPGSSFTVTGSTSIQSAEVRFIWSKKGFIGEEHLVEMVTIFRDIFQPKRRHQDLLLQALENHIGALTKHQKEIAINTLRAPPAEPTYEELLIQALRDQGREVCP